MIDKLPRVVYFYFHDSIIDTLSMHGGSCVTSHVRRNRLLNSFNCEINVALFIVIDNICDVHTPYVEIRGGLS